MEQLADYPESYVVIPGSRRDRETLPQMLGISETSLEAAFLTPEPVLELGTSMVVLLRPRVAPGRSPSDEELRSNMFYAW